MKTSFAAIMCGAIVALAVAFGCARTAKVEAAQRPDRPQRAQRQRRQAGEDRPEAGEGLAHRGQAAREVPADAWRTPDEYWTRWRDIRLTRAMAPVTGRAYHASPNGNDENPGTSARPWRTLQKAAIVMGPGDTLMLADGEYPGNIHIRRSGQQGRPITYRAEHVGKAIIDGEKMGMDYGKEAGGGRQSAVGGRQSAVGRRRILAEGDSQIQNPKSEIQNPGGADFRFAATRDALTVYHADFVVIEGLVVHAAPRSGIRVDNSNNVTVRGCRAVQNGKWGIFTDYSDDLLLEYNEAAYSADQHGIYFSNSGDRPVIRFNSCHDNSKAGIQLNGDSKQRKPELGKRGDGIIQNAVVESNVIYENGATGASGINLACVDDSKIANNLIFNNLAGGISMFNDHRRDVTDFGCKRNRVVHNTIYFRPGEGRFCTSFKHGSTDNVLRNNILCGGRRGAYEFDDTSSFVSENNLLWSANPRAPMGSDQDSKADYAFEQLKAPGCAHAEPQFVRMSPPFDFHLKAVPVRAAEETSVGVDLDGKPRSGRRTVGCYEP